MKPLSRDARGFVDSVESYIRSNAKGKQVLPKVASLLTKVTNSAKRERTAHVVSAVALTQSEKSAVVKMVSDVLGHEVECSFTVDHALLGGLKIQVADWVIDTSLSTQLASIAQNLL